MINFQPVNIEIFLDIFKKFSKLIYLLIFLIIIFALYNSFLIDYTLDDLRFTLNQTSLAYDISDLDGLDIILTGALTKEIAPQNLNSANLMNLEFSRNIASEGKTFQQLDYMKVALEGVIKNKEQGRSKFFIIFDRINLFVRKAVGFVLHLPQYLKKRKVEPISAAGADLYYKAREYEKENKLKEANQLYSQFIKDYPDYERIALVKLRLGYTYQKLGELEKAASIYRGIINNHFFQKESDIAQTLLFQLNQRDKVIDRMNALIARLTEIPEADKTTQQQIYYELGAINTQLLNFEEAEKFFSRAQKVVEESNLGIKSRFNSAWLNKELGDYEQGISELTLIIENNPDSIIALDSNYQMADIYHKEGKYESAVDKYLEIAQRAEGTELAALALFQAGASYMYDLNNDEKAKEIFTMLTNKYPQSRYAQYLAPDNPVGIFVTYLVPRATRVVTWRVGGLLCLSGFSGELVKFKAKMTQESLNNLASGWLKAELPDTIGNLYVDVKGTEITLEKDKAIGTGNITMGKFNVKGEAEGRVELAKDNSINVFITKAMLEKIPIPPILINSAISGISLIAKKYFPVIFSEVSIKEGEITAEGYGGKNLIKRAEEISDKRITAFEIETQDINNDAEGQKMYALFNERFPGSMFSANPQYNTETLFYDFFTRIYFYISFKLMETVKDSKLDYERSVRTLGRLMVKQDRFGVSFKEVEINNALNQYVYNEFPWLIDKKFLLDVLGVELSFHDGEIISLLANLRLGYGEIPVEGKDVKLKLIGKIEIDPETAIPKIIFQEAFMNDEALSLDRLNLISTRCHDLLRDARLPFKLEEVKTQEGGIYLKGMGARDFISRIFSDPHLFIIFQVREWDMHVAGIEKLERKPQGKEDYWMGREIEGWVPR